MLLNPYTVLYCVIVYDTITDNIYYSLKCYFDFQRLKNNCNRQNIYTLLEWTESGIFLVYLLIGSYGQKP